MFTSVQRAYSQYEQLAFDDYFEALRDPRDKLSDTLEDAVKGLKMTLNSVWPSAKKVRYVDISCIR